MTTNESIRVQGVTKRFGSKIALNDVTLSVEKGTVFALLGENGAGKTTLIRCLLGLDKPSQGNIEILGLDPAKQGLQLRRKIGYVADSPSLYDWMTVSEIGWFTAGFYPEGFQDKYAELTHQFELSPSQKIKNLSRGMKALVNLSLTMAHDPELLIMDEPTSGLDTVVRRRFLESMIDLAATGRTVLLASHQIPEIERVADQVAIIHKGENKVTDSLDNLKAKMEWWTVMLHEGKTQLPDVGIQTHLVEGKSREYRLLVDSATTDQLCQLRAHDHVQSVEVDVPNLEELFISYIDGDSSSSSNVISTSVDEVQQVGEAQ